MLACTGQVTAGKLGMSGAPIAIGHQRREIRHRREIAFAKAGDREQDDVAIHVEMAP